MTDVTEGSTLLKQYPILAQVLRSHSLDLSEDKDNDTSPSDSEEVSKKNLPIQIKGCKIFLVDFVKELNKQGEAEQRKNPSWVVEDLSQYEGQEQGTSSLRKVFRKTGHTNNDQESSKEHETSEEENELEKIKNQRRRKRETKVSKDFNSKDMKRPRLNNAHLPKKDNGVSKSWSKKGKKKKFEAIRDKQIDVQTPKQPEQKIRCVPLSKLLSKETLQKLGEAIADNLQPEMLRRGGEFPQEVQRDKPQSTEPTTSRNVAQKGELQPMNPEDDKLKAQSRLPDQSGSQPKIHPSPQPIRTSQEVMTAVGARPHTPRPQPQPQEDPPDGPQPEPSSSFEVSKIPEQEKNQEQEKGTEEESRLQAKSPVHMTNLEKVNTVQMEDNELNQDKMPRHQTEVRVLPDLTSDYSLDQIYQILLDAEIKLNTTYARGTPGSLLKNLITRMKEIQEIIKTLKDPTVIRQHQRREIAIRKLLSRKFGMLEHGEAPNPGEMIKIPFPTDLSTSWTFSPTKTQMITIKVGPIQSHPATVRQVAEQIKMSNVETQCEKRQEKENEEHLVEKQGEVRGEKEKEEGSQKEHQEEERGGEEDPSSTCEEQELSQTVDSSSKRTVPPQEENSDVGNKLQTAPPEETALQFQQAIPYPLEFKDPILGASQPIENQRWRRTWDDETIKTLATIPNTVPMHLFRYKRLTTEEMEEEDKKETSRLRVIGKLREKEGELAEGKVPDYVTRLTEISEKKIVYHPIWLHHQIWEFRSWRQRENSPQRYYRCLKDEFSARMYRTREQPPDVFDLAVRLPIERKEDIKRSPLSIEGLLTADEPENVQSFAQGMEYFARTGTKETLYGQLEMIVAFLLKARDGATAHQFRDIRLNGLESNHDWQRGITTLFAIKVRRCVNLPLHHWNMDKARHNEVKILRNWLTPLYAVLIRKRLDCQGFHLVMFIKPSKPLHKFCTGWVAGKNEFKAVGDVNAYIPHDPLTDSVIAPPVYLPPPVLPSSEILDVDRVKEAILQVWKEISGLARSPETDTSTLAFGIRGLD